MLQICAAFPALNSDTGKTLDEAILFSQLSRATEHTDWQFPPDRVRALVDTASPTFAAENPGDDAVDRAPRHTPTWVTLPASLP